MDIKTSGKGLIQTMKIFAALKDQGEKGMSIDEIDNALIEYSRRTLQRRLQEMQPELIFSAGEARATRYFSNNVDKSRIVGINTVHETQPGDVPKPGLARSIRHKDERQPVGYHRDFLEEYNPQQTSYLLHEDKEILAAIGKTDYLGKPCGTHAKQILPRLLVDLSYNSCRLEGNAYSLPETKQLIKFDEAADDKTVKETQMIVNHKQAIEFIVFAEDELAISRHVLTNLHAVLSDNLFPGSELYGTLRSVPVKLEGSVYTAPASPLLIEEMFEMIVEKATQIEDPFEQSFFLMVHLSYLQPFENVNNQVSRMAMNIPFIKNNLSPISFGEVAVDSYNNALSEVYELNRVELLKDVFISAYKRSAQLYADFQLPPGDPALFRMKYRDQFRRLISRVVTGAFTGEQASLLIKEKSLDIEDNDRAKFIEYVNTELISLHEGNFARYRIRPLEFKMWKKLDRK